MVLAKTEGERGKNRVTPLRVGTGTGDSLQRKNLVNFSDGNIMISTSGAFAAVLSIISLVGGIVWFVATEWVFDVKLEKVKSELYRDTYGDITELKDGFDDRLDVLEAPLLNAAKSPPAN